MPRRSAWRARRSHKVPSTIRPGPRSPAPGRSNWPWPGPCAGAATHATGDAARLAALRTELDAARLDLDRFDEESGVVHAAVRTRDATTGANDTVLPPGMSATAVVEYVVGERSTVVFVLRGAGR